MSKQCAPPLFFTMPVWNSMKLPGSSQQQPFHKWVKSFLKDTSYFHSSSFSQFTIKESFWSHFFCYDKIWNGKIHWQMWKFFCHWILKTFCHLDRANSIKTALQTCNLSTGLSLSYKSVSWFWLNLPPQWQFFFSYLQMNIFCQFDFCHNRRNGFRLEFMNVLHIL